MKTARERRSVCDARSSKKKQIRAVEQREQMPSGEHAPLRPTRQHYHRHRTLNETAPRWCRRASFLTALLQQTAESSVRFSSDGSAENTG